MTRFHIRTVFALAVFLISAIFVIAQDQPTTAPPLSADDLAGRWPMHVSSDAGDITVFQPQLDDFQGDQISARAAVSVAVPNQQQPIFGAIWLQSRVSTDRVARTVQILGVTITRSRFPNVDPAMEKTLTVAIGQAIAENPPTLSLDQLLTMMETIQKQQAAAADLQNTPPKIVFLDHPAVKVQYDGQPRLIAAGDGSLMRVGNTPFFVVLDPQSKTYFLKGAGKWFSAPDPLGPFQSAASVPPAVSALADASDYKDPQTPLTPTQYASLEIVTATDPTELIWTDGEPQMGTIAGTDLLYVTNTDSDVFLLIDTQQLYVLLSGRWYVAPNRNGPWTYVPPDKLPDDFRRIPANSDKGDVLAQVGGTQAAQDAVANQSVPQTAAIDRQNFDQPVVVYDGTPQFQPVPNVDCSYAVNTAQSVISCQGEYYCCNNAVWYSCSNPNGPWSLCVSVPAPIYLIPPSCPLYPCRFVYVYGYTSQLVYCGYLPGYVGCYISDGCCVFGTGYYYGAWWGQVYYPRPCTFGFAAKYNCYLGHWGFNFGLATGGGGSWIGNGPNSWGREHPWFGFGGYRPPFEHRDVHAPIFHTEYLNRVHPTPNQPIHPDTYNRNLYDQRHDVRPTVATEHPAESKHPLPQVTKSDEANDIFIDHEGNVYRKTIDGWQTRDQDQWRPSTPAERAKVAEPPGEDHTRQVVVEPHDNTPEPHEPVHISTPQPQEPRSNEQDMNQEYRARVEGQQRLQNYERPSPPPEAQRAPEEQRAPEPAREPEPQRAPEPAPSGGGGGGSRR